MKNIMKRVAVLLCISMLFSIVSQVIPYGIVTGEVDAASKAKVYPKNITIGIQSSPEYISVDGDYDAVTTYSSSDTKIVKLAEKQQYYCLVIGQKVGKATITVKQKVNGKSVQVGTVNVTVKKSKIQDGTVSLSAYSEIDLSQWRWIESFVKYPNSKAKYVLEPSDPNVIAYNADTDLYEVCGSGNTKVTVKEIYKGKTRNLGKIKLNVETPYLECSDTLPVSALATPLEDFMFIRNIYYDVPIKYTSSDTNILEFMDGDWDMYVRGKQEGTVEITSTTTMNGETVLIASKTIEVQNKYPKTLELKTYYLSDGDGGNPTLYMDTSYDEYDNMNVRSLFSVNNDSDRQYNYSVSFDISDPEVLSIDAFGNIHPKKIGETKVTIRAGELSTSFRIVVE